MRKRIAKLLGGAALLAAVLGTQALAGAARPAQVRILSPRGGEYYAVGQTQDIAVQLLATAAAIKLLF